MAAEFQLPYEICSLEDTKALNDMVLGVDAVLHCAGPFAQTARPMVMACLKNKTHYLDITGEIAVFEMMAALDEEAKRADVMVLPGVGFDVVPSDCLAAYLKAHMQDATHLTLAFMGVGGGVSHGTATTMLQNLDSGGAIRQNGIIKKVPAAYKTRKIAFRRHPKLCVTIPWGDVSTAYHSTGIPNIEVYTAVSKGIVNLLKLSNSLGWLLRRKFVKRFLQARVDNAPAGPSAEKRAKGKSLLWGEVKNAAGKTLEARLVTPEGYRLTALAALAAVQKVLLGNAPVGFQTPATAYGYNFVTEIEGVNREGLPRNIRVD